VRKCKVVPVLNLLSTTQWRHMGSDEQIHIFLTLALVGFCG
jgi:hypothetical protein